jgi:hypothetical protein
MTPEMTMLMSKKRTARGSALIETPLAISLFLLVILFPLIDLGTLFFGASSVHTAASVAVVEASRALQFANDSQVNGKPALSAVHRAQQKATELATGNVSISADDVTVQVIQIPIDGGTPSTITPGPAFNPDTGSNLYQLQVSVIGRVRPLVMLSEKIFGQVPGLTVPLDVRAASTARYENPSGLSS